MRAVTFFWGHEGGIVVLVDRHLVVVEAEGRVAGALEGIGLERVLPLVVVHLDGQLVRLRVSEDEAHPGAVRVERAELLEGGRGDGSAHLHQVVAEEVAHLQLRLLLLGELVVVIDVAAILEIIVHHRLSTFFSLLFGQLSFSLSISGAEINYLFMSLNMYIIGAFLLIDCLRVSLIFDS